jgi:hypothetical protein
MVPGKRNDFDDERLLVPLGAYGALAAYGPLAAYGALGARRSLAP